MRIISNPKKLLLTCPHHLGDFVAKVPFIRTLKQAIPSCEIIVMARSYVEDLVSLIDEVDHFIDFEDFFSQSDEAIVENLKSIEADVLLHIPSLAHHYGPDVIRYGKEASIPNRIGNVCKSSLTLFKKKQFGLTHNVRRPRLIETVHEFEWNLYPLEFFGLSPKKTITECLSTKSPHKLPHPALKPDCFNLVIHPGSHGNSKEWPPKFFRSLIDSQDSSVHVLITGSKEEKHRFSELREFNISLTDLRGEQSLSDLIWLLSFADGLVAGSTGPHSYCFIIQYPYTRTLSTAGKSRAESLGTQRGFC